MEAIVSAIVRWALSCCIHARQSAPRRRNKRRTPERHCRSMTDASLDVLGDGPTKSLLLTVTAKAALGGHVRPVAR